MGMNAILAFGGIICFLGFVVIFLVYYFWKIHNRTDLDLHAPVKLSPEAGEQRRQHPRMDINWPVSMEIPDGTIDAEVKNISLGGAFICCKRPLPIGEVFHLTMMAPGDEPVKATAQVVWSNVNVPEDKVVNRGMGVRFIKMSDRHIQLVKQISQGSGA
ncbi:MAG: PilZ domain-containing protein [Syntrophaceae bacterium]|nr:PilZ domain-containing protein [Syntrophaceae bacterium]